MPPLNPIKLCESIDVNTDGLIPLPSLSSLLSSLSSSLLNVEMTVGEMREVEREYGRGGRVDDKTLFSALSLPSSSSHHAPYQPHPSSFGSTYEEPLSSSLSSSSSSSSSSTDLSPLLSHQLLSSLASLPPSSLSNTLHSYSSPPLHSTPPLPPHLPRGSKVDWREMWSGRGRSRGE